MTMLQSLWPAMALAFGVGLLFQGVVGGGQASLSARPWAVATALLALLLGASAAWLQWIPGRAGVWLDVAVLVAASYAAGCALAVMASRLRRRRTTPIGEGAS